MLVVDFTISLSPWGSPRKEPRCSCPKYLGFIATKPCEVRWCKNPSTVHHLVRGRTRNNRSSDILTVSLCEEHHTGKTDGIDGRYGGNHAEFEKKHDLNFIEIILRNWHQLFDSRGWDGAFGNLIQLENYIVANI